MNIVIDIGHPAQIHLFRHLIEHLKKNNDQVLITTIDKEITLNLLDEYELEYVNLGRTGNYLLTKILSIPRLDYLFYQAIKHFQTDLFIGSASFRAAHLSRLYHKPCIQMVDTEMGWKEHCVYAPFSDVIATPSCYRRDLGKKHLRYNSYQELAYLHPKYFSPDPCIWKALGLAEGEPFSILRFVAWKATHDVGHHGLSLEEKRRIISRLKKEGTVFITSEETLPEEFQSYELSLPKHHFLDVLAFARMVVTESNTVATEAALLGTPVVRINSYVGPNDMGNFKELEERYDLLYSFENYEQAEPVLESLLRHPFLHVEQENKRQRLLKEKSDVTEWMVKLIQERYR